jgi:GH24 family phage-related lysozyme (muramidase)
MASRLAKTAGNAAAYRIVNVGPDDVRAEKLCAEVTRDVTAVAAEVARRSTDGGGAALVSRQSAEVTFDTYAQP